MSFVHAGQVPEPQQSGIDPAGGAEDLQSFHPAGAGQSPPVGLHDAVHLDPRLTHRLISAGTGGLTGPLERPVIGARAQSQSSGKDREQNSFFHDELLLVIVAYFRVSTASTGLWSEAVRSGRTRKLSTVNFSFG